MHDVLHEEEHPGERTKFLNNNLKKKQPNTCAWVQVLSQGSDRLRRKVFQLHRGRGRIMDRWYIAMEYLLHRLGHRLPIFRLYGGVASFSALPGAGV